LTGTASEEKEYYMLIKRAFTKLAPFYDFMVLPLSGLRERVVSLTGAMSGARILDVATGTGKQAFAFARKGFDVLGGDLSETMLEIARKKNQYDNVRFETADATNLRLEDNSFDVSTISFALHDMPLFIREKVLKEMARVTKQKGMIMVVDYDLPRNVVGRFLIYRLVSLYEGEYYSKFIISDLDSLLRETGIEVVEGVAVLLGGGRILKGIKKV